MAKQTLTTIKDEHFGIARKIVSNMKAGKQFLTVRQLMTQRLLSLCRC
jgi:hypothetical protein